MEGHNSGSLPQKLYGSYDDFTPPLRKKLIRKMEETSIGDLVEAKFVIYGPAFGLEGYGASYASGPLGGASGSQGIGTSSQKIYADLLDEIYGGPSVSVERGTLGVVLDKSSFNTDLNQHLNSPGGELRFLEIPDYERDFYDQDKDPLVKIRVFAYFGEELADGKYRLAPKTRKVLFSLPA